MTTTSASAASTATSRTSPSSTAACRPFTYDMDEDAYEAMGIIADGMDDTDDAVADHAVGPHGPRTPLADAVSSSGRIVKHARSLV